MKKTLCTLCIFMFMLAGVSWATGSSPVHVAKADALQAPEFTNVPPSSAVCGATIRISFANGNEGSTTEIYRSTSSSGPFQLLTTRTSGGHEYFDHQVAPRRYYYYKLRAVSGSETSAYSETKGFRSESEFYNPDLWADYPQMENHTTIVLQFQDNSYADISYTISRWDEESDLTASIAVINNADSGRLYTFNDTGLVPGRLYHYWVDAIINCDGQQEMHNVAEVDFAPDGLWAPHLDFNTNEPCGNMAIFSIENRPEGSKVEVYRSRSAAGQFELIDDDAPFEFKDLDLVSNVHYFYKARAVLNGGVSEFSNVLNIKTEHGLYLPILTLSVLPDETVEIKFTDQSHQDSRYDISGVELGTGRGTFWVEFGADSGATYTFHDTEVRAGHSYVYQVDVESTCYGYTWYRNIVSDTITVEDMHRELFIDGFTLVDPETDQDIGPLVNNDYIDPTGRPNIRANADAKTSSVVFYLNGVKRVENEAPYAYFTDRNGDYRPGRLKNGHYVLEATSYSGNNGKGTKGTTRTIEFDVYGSPASLASREEAPGVEVSLFPNPVVTNTKIEITAMPMSNVHVLIVDQYGMSKATTFEGVLDEEGIWTQSLNALNLNKGSYILQVTIDKEKYFKRFVVK
jgi:hypothetical protein